MFEEFKIIQQDWGNRSFKVFKYNFYNLNCFWRDLNECIEFEVRNDGNVFGNGVLVSMVGGDLKIKSVGWYVIV